MVGMSLLPLTSQAVSVSLQNARGGRSWLTTMDLTAVNAANDLLGHVESSVGQKSNSGT